MRSESKSKRDVKALWDAMTEGEPEVDESAPITSSDVNLQTAARIAGLSERHEGVGDE